MKKVILTLMMMVSIILIIIGIAGCPGSDTNGTDPTSEPTTEVTDVPTPVLTDEPTLVPTPIPTQPHGELDISFGSDGIVTTDFYGDDDYGMAMDIQSDGKIIIAGYSMATNDNFALARYTTAGELDSTFSDDGKETTTIGSAEDRGRGVIIQSDGKIVVGGYAMMTNYDFALAQYTTAGDLDTGFGSSGRVTSSTANLNLGNAVGVQTNGRILVAGNASNANNDFALARYSTAGILDTNFSGDGVAAADFGSDDTAYAVAVQTDGMIVIAGSAYVGSNDNIAVARFTATGVLDTTFSGDGIVNTDLGGWDTAYAVGIQGDGRIVVAGNTTASQLAAIVRYNSDGTLDTAFDGDGIVTADLGSGNDCAYALVIQSDGKIVIGGASGSDFVLARYNTDGSPDTDFGTNGVVITSIESGNDSVRSLKIQSDGKIVAGGYSDDGTDIDFAIVRYWP